MKKFIVLLMVIVIMHNIYAQTQIITYRIDSMFYMGGDTIKRKTPFTKVVFTISKRKYITDIAFIGSNIKKELKANNLSFPKMPPSDCYECKQDNWGDFVFNKDFDYVVKDSLQIDNEGYHLLDYKGATPFVYNNFNIVIAVDLDELTFYGITVPYAEEDEQKCYESAHLILNKDFYISKITSNKKIANNKTIKPVKAVPHSAEPLTPIQ